MVQHGQTVKLPSNPKVVTYNKFLEILQNTKVGITIKALCEIACNEEKQIAEYLGKNWSMEGNIKVKVVIDMIKNHSNIKMINSRPLVLQWLPDTTDTTDTDIDMVSQEIEHYDNRINVKSETYQVSDISVVSARNKTDRQTERLTNVSYGLILFFKGSIFLNHLQHGLSTCQYCGQVADAYWSKHHNCPEKETAITETTEAYVEG